MHPAIQDGDILRVDPLVRGTVCIGDVVFYLTSTGKPIVHRVIGKCWRAGFLIKGDSVSRLDGLLPASRIKGRITVVERGDTVVECGAGQGRYQAVLKSWSRWLAGPVWRQLARSRRDRGQPIPTSYYGDEENVDSD